LDIEQNTISNYEFNILDFIYDYYLN